MSKAEQNPFMKKKHEVVIPVDNRNASGEKDLPLAKRIDQVLRREDATTDQKLNDWQSIMLDLDKHEQEMTAIKTIPCCLRIPNGWAGVGGTFIVLFAGGAIGVLGYLLSKYPDELILLATAMGLTFLVGVIAAHALASGHQLTRRIDNYDGAKMMIAVRAARAQFELAKSIQQNLKGFETSLATQKVQLLNLTKQNSRLSTNNEKLSGTNDELKKTNGNFKKSIQRFKEELKIFKGLGKEIFDKCTKLDEGTDRLEKGNDRFDKGNERFEKGNEKFEQTEAQLAASLQKNTELAEQLAVLTDRLDELVSELTARNDYETFEKIETLYDEHIDNISQMISVLEGMIPSLKDRPKKILMQAVSLIKGLQESFQPTSSQKASSKKAKRGGVSNRRSTQIFGDLKTLRNDNRGPAAHQRGGVGV